MKYSVFALTLAACMGNPHLQRIPGPDDVEHEPSDPEPAATDDDPEPADPAPADPGPEPARCTPETDAALCAVIGTSCGTASAFDGCGTLRDLTCGGECPPPCAPIPDLTLCAGACGSVYVTDDGCGARRAIWCGPCPCVPEDDATLCAASPGLCGSQDLTDRCDAVRHVECPA